MPAWGQLGCNGFIVLDGSHAVVCKASRAYLEVKDAAFRHVETLLSALIVEKPLPPQATESGRVDASVGGACAKVRFGADGKAEAEPEPEPEAEAGSGPPSKVASVKVATDIGWIRGRHAHTHTHAHTRTHTHTHTRTHTCTCTCVWVEAAPPSIKGGCARRGARAVRGGAGTAGGAA